MCLFRQTWKKKWSNFCLEVSSSSCTLTDHYFSEFVFHFVAKCRAHSTQVVDSVRNEQVGGSNEAVQNLY